MRRQINNLVLADYDLDDCSFCKDVIEELAIDISLKTVHDGVELMDYLLGFEQQYSDKIFEVFQRLHGKHDYTGTGIGLAIVKRIVENHNGFVTATGEPGKGATFNIICLLNE